MLVTEHPLHRALHNEVRPSTRTHGRTFGHLPHGDLVGHPSVAFQST